MCRFLVRACLVEVVCKRFARCIVLKAMGKHITAAESDYIRELVEGIGSKDLGDGRNQSQTAATNHLDMIDIKNDILEIKRMLGGLLVTKPAALTTKSMKVWRKIAKAASQPEAELVQIIIYAGGSKQRRKAHRVKVAHGLSAEWRTCCGWRYGMGSKSELMAPVAFDKIDKGTIRASWCTYCFSPPQLAKLQQGEESMPVASSVN